MPDDRPNRPTSDGNLTRRQVTASAAPASLFAVIGPQSLSARNQQERGVDTIITNARVTTLDPANPEAQAIAIRSGLIAAVGTGDDIMRLADRRTRVIDAARRRVIPGLNDSHTHHIRGGLNFNMELRWEGSAWFSGEQDVKGTLAPGQYADLAILSADLMAVPPEQIRRIDSVMTMVGGKVVYGESDFAHLAPPLPPASPFWSPVEAFANPAMRSGDLQASAGLGRDCHDGCANGCGVHGHDHGIAWNNPIPVRDLKSFWGAIGCPCFAV